MKSTVIQTSPTMPPTIFFFSRSETAKRRYRGFPIFCSLYRRRSPRTARLVSPIVRSTAIAGMASAQRYVDRRFGKLCVEAALIEFGHQRPLQLVTFVEEGDAERKADIAENLGILRPRDHGARAHYRRQIAIGEREI